MFTRVSQPNATEPLRRSEGTEDASQASESAGECDMTRRDRNMTHDVILVYPVAMEETATLCLIGQALHDLPEPYATALSEIVTTKASRGGFSAARAAKIMREAGLKSSETSVTRHRLGECACQANGTTWKTQNLIDFFKSAQMVTP